MIARRVKLDPMDIGNAVFLLDLVGLHVTWFQSTCHLFAFCGYMFYFLALLYMQRLVPHGGSGRRYISLGFDSYFLRGPPKVKGTVKAGY